MVAYLTKRAATKQLAKLMLNDVPVEMRVVYYRVPRKRRTGMKRRYDVPLGRVVWVVETETPLEDFVYTLPTAAPAPPTLPASGLSQVIAAQNLQAAYINAAVQQMQSNVMVSSFKMYWSEAQLGTTRKEFTSKRRAQVAVAKAVLQDVKARMFERRDNDFSGWKK